MPKAVQLFARLSYGSIALGVVSLLLLLPISMAGAGTHMRYMETIASVAPLVLFSNAVPAVLIWLAAWKRHSWARYALALLYVFGLVVVAFDPSSLVASGLPGISVFAVQTLLQGAALLYVFSSAAKPWFDKHSRA